MVMAKILAMNVSGAASEWINAIAEFISAQTDTAKMIAINEFVSAAVH